MGEIYSKTEDEPASLRRPPRGNQRHFQSSVSPNSIAAPTHSPALLVPTTTGVSMGNNMLNNPSISVAFTSQQQHLAFMDYQVSPPNGSSVPVVSTSIGSRPISVFTPSSSKTTRPYSATNLSGGVSSVRGEQNSVDGTTCEQMSPTTAVPPPHASVSDPSTPTAPKTEEEYPWKRRRFLPLKNELQNKVDSSSSSSASCLGVLESGIPDGACVTCETVAISQRLSHLDKVLSEREKEHHRLVQQQVQLISRMASHVCPATAASATKNDEKTQVSSLAKRKDSQEYMSSLWKKKRRKTSKECGQMGLATSPHHHHHHRRHLQSQSSRSSCPTAVHSVSVQRRRRFRCLRSILLLRDEKMKSNNTEVQQLTRKWRLKRIAALARGSVRPSFNVSHIRKYLARLHKPKRRRQFKGAVLIKDPVGEYKREMCALKKWTPEEKACFSEKFAVYGKSFHLIAEHLPGKQVQDCIHLYYLSKKTVPYKLLASKVQTRRSWGVTREIHLLPSLPSAVPAPSAVKVETSQPPENSTPQLTASKRTSPPIPSSEVNHVNGTRRVENAVPAKTFTPPNVVPCIKDIIHSVIDNALSNDEFMNFIPEAKPPGASAKSVATSKTECKRAIASLRKGPPLRNSPPSSNNSSSSDTHRQNGVVSVSKTVNNNKIHKQQSAVSSGQPPAMTQPYYSSYPATGNTESHHNRAHQLPTQEHTYRGNQSSHSSNNRPSPTTPQRQFAPGSGGALPVTGVLSSPVRLVAAGRQAPTVTPSAPTHKVSAFTSLSPEGSSAYHDLYASICQQQHQQQMLQKQQQQQQQSQQATMIAGSYSLEPFYSSLLPWPPGGGGGGGGGHCFPVAKTTAQRMQVTESCAPRSAVGMDVQALYSTAASKGTTFNGVPHRVMQLRGYPDEHSLAALNSNNYQTVEKVRSGGFMNPATVFMTAATASLGAGGNASEGGNSNPNSINVRASTLLDAIIHKHIADGPSQKITTTSSDVNQPPLIRKLSAFSKPVSTTAGNPSAPNGLIVMPTMTRAPPPSVASSGPPPQATALPPRPMESVTRPVAPAAMQPLPSTMRGCIDKFIEDYVQVASPPPSPDPKEVPQPSAPKKRGRPPRSYGPSATAPASSSSPLQPPQPTPSQQPQQAPIVSKVSTSLSHPLIGERNGLQAGPSSSAAASVNVKSEYCVPLKKRSLPPQFRWENTDNNS